MRTSKGYLYPELAVYNKGVSLHCLVLAETQRQPEEWGKFMVETREGSGAP